VAERCGRSALAHGERLAYSPDEAARLLGVSRDFFDRHIRGELRVIYRGRLVLIPVRELELWLAQSAQRTLAADV
jgi:excisionase family DNA binding protein